MQMRWPSQSGSNGSLGDRAPLGGTTSPCTTTHTRSVQLCEWMGAAVIYTRCEHRAAGLLADSAIEAQSSD